MSVTNPARGEKEFRRKDFVKKFSSKSTKRVSNFCTNESKGERKQVEKGRERDKEAGRESQSISYIHSHTHTHTHTHSHTHTHTLQFLEAFQMTQMFENFIEQRENPSKAATVSESLFERKIPDLSLGCQEIEM
jgi:hypothetical protein